MSLCDVLGRVGDFGPPGEPGPDCATPIPGPPGHSGCLGPDGEPGQSKRFRLNELVIHAG